MIINNVYVYHPLKNPDRVCVLVDSAIANLSPDQVNA